MDKDKLLKILFEQKNRMYRLAFRILLNNFEAEEAVQETIIKIWKINKSFNEGKDIQIYSTTILRNHCIDKLRSKHRKIIKIDINEIDFEIEDNNEIPLLLTENKDIKIIIEQIINEFPELWRTVFQLRDIEGFSTEETAKILEINIQDVKNHIVRVRKRIKNILEKQYKYEYKD